MTHNGCKLAFVADFEKQQYQFKTTFNMKNETSTTHELGNNANLLLATGLISKKRVPWNKGKRKPYADQDGDLWCDCDNPKLTSSFHGRGQASCLLCGYPWFH